MFGQYSLKGYPFKRDRDYESKEMESIRQAQG